METLVQTPPQIEHFNREARAYNDATTWLAETLDGRMRTSFEYNFDGSELYADDGSSLKPIFEKSLDDAAKLAKEAPKLSFERRRRQSELAEYEDMVGMAKGNLLNTMIVISDFPAELVGSKSDIGGYNVSRKQTMLRVITRQPDGGLRMQSQSLDGSNRQALESIYGSFGLHPEPGELLNQRIYTEADEYEQEFLADKLTGVYDRSLEERHFGKRYRAGRLQPDRPDVETHLFVRSQTDLISYLTEKMLLGKMNEQIMFSVAATMTNRYEDAANGTNFTPTTRTRSDLGKVMPVLEQEIRLAAAVASSDGRTFSGCGASVGTNGGLSASEQLSASGIGNKSDDDCEFTSKECPKCHKKNVKTVSKNGKYYGACGCHS